MIFDILVKLILQIVSNIEDSYRLTYLYEIILVIGAHQINVILALIRCILIHHKINVFVVVERPVANGKFVFFQKLRPVSI